MSEVLAAGQWLASPLAVLGGALMLSYVLGLLLQRAGLPRLYGAVLVGLSLGSTGLGAIDRALLGQFDELINAASALVLFEAGRKTDVLWLVRSGRQGLSLLLATVMRGVAVALLLAAFGLEWSAAVFIGVLMVAVNPVIVSSMTLDTNAAGIGSFATANMVGLSNLVALLALGVALAWARSTGGDANVAFLPELGRQAGKVLLGIVLALACYGMYVAATRLTRAQASLRPGMLLAALLVDLGLCSISAASALVSLLLMGLLLRNAEARDNVFQAQLKTGQDIGYVMLFLASAALVDLSELGRPQVLGMAVAVFLVRLAVTRLALAPAPAWTARKKHAMALTMCSLVGFGGLVVDTSLQTYTGLDPVSTQVMGALLVLNALLGPGLTWWGLHLAGETDKELTDD